MRNRSKGILQWDDRLIFGWLIPMIAYVVVAGIFIRWTNQIAGESRAGIGPFMWSVVLFPVFGILNSWIFLLRTTKRWMLLLAGADCPWESRSCSWP